MVHSSDADEERSEKEAEEEKFSRVLEIIKHPSNPSFPGYE